MNQDLTKTSLPTLTPEGSFSSYLSKIRKFPMLDAEEEYMLAKNWRENQQHSQLDTRSSETETQERACDFHAKPRVSSHRRRSSTTSAGVR